ncbi:60S ribosomal protein L7a-2 [Glycine max]|nr:60S ribosomal protein L7a-2 [Glycine max]
MPKLPKLHRKGSTLLRHTTATAAMAPKRGGKAPAIAAKTKPVHNYSEFNSIRDLVSNLLFEKRPKKFRIGGALPPKRDLTRFMKWPKNVQIQRKKRILKQRLKVSPALDQFTKTLDKNLGTSEYDYLSTIGYYFGDVYVVTLRHAPVSHYYGGLRREVNGFKDAKKGVPDLSEYRDVY